MGTEIHKEPFVIYRQGWGEDFGDHMVFRRNGRRGDQSPPTDCTGGTIGNCLSINDQ